MLIPNITLVHQTGRSDCGPAALATVIKYWKPTTADAAVERSVGNTDDRRGIEAGRLRAVAQAYGLKAFLVEGTVDDLAYELNRRRPVILGLLTTKDGHAVGHYEIVVGVNPRRKLFLLADPRGAWHEVSVDDLFSQWRPARHLALVVFP